MSSCASVPPLGYISIVNTTAAGGVVGAMLNDFIGNISNLGTTSGGAFSMNFGNTQPSPVQSVTTGGSVAGSIPIYSTDSIKLARNNAWSEINTNSQSPVGAVWGGTNNLFYDVNFRLVAGWGKEIPNRAELAKIIRLYASASAYRMDLGSLGGAPRCPTPVLVNIPGIIVMTGVFWESCIMIEKPFVYENGVVVPTACTFTGRIMMIPQLTDDGWLPWGGNVSLMNAATVNQFLYAPPNGGTATGISYYPTQTTPAQTAPANPPAAGTANSAAPVAKPVAAAPDTLPSNSPTNVNGVSVSGSNASLFGPPGNTDLSAINAPTLAQPQASDQP